MLYKYPIQVVQRVSTMRSRNKIVGYISAGICFLHLAGCGTSKQNESTDEIDETSSNSNTLPIENDSVDPEQSGMEASQPIDIGFWRETDERLVMHRYEMNRGNSGQYSEIREINRFQMSAETLEALSIAKNEIFPPANLYAIDNQLGDLPAVERASNGLVVCLPEISDFDAFHIFTSSGTEGDPTTVASSISCGPIDLFSRPEISGTLDPVFMQFIFMTEAE